MPKPYKIANLFTSLVLVAGLILANVLVAHAQTAQSSGIKMQVEPHFSGHFKFGEWLPLRVTLENDGPPLRAELRADTTEAGGQTAYIAPVELPTGARKRITLYVMPPSFAQAVRVRLMDQDRELAAQSVKVSVERNINYLVGIIAPQTEAFAVLAGLVLDAPQQDARFGMGWAQNSRSVGTLALSLADIPDRPEGLRALDALIISGVDTSGLAPEQARALQGWVEQGGRLILGGGVGAARTLAGISPTLSGDLLAPGVTADVQSLGGLGQFAGQDVRVPGPFAVTWPTPVQGMLVEQDGHALLLDRRMGEGYVTYSALDLAASPFDAWAGASSFWLKLLEPGSSYPIGAPEDASPRLVRANTLSYTLQNLPALALPSIRSLGGLLVIYVMLVGPLNYLVLRRLRKLEWGWVSILVLTLLFSVGAFAFGFSLRGGDVIVNRISILTFSPRGGVPVQTFVGIFSPERRAYTVSLPGSSLIFPMSLEGNPWSSGMPSAGAMTIVQGDPAQVRSVQVDQWAMQSFQAESALPEEWAIESELTFDGEHMRGTITNRTNEVVVDAVIVHGNRFARIGDLSPGQSLSIDHLLQNPSGTPFPYFIYEQMWQNSGPNGPPRELQMRQQMLEGYYSSMKGGATAPNATLIGWMRTSPLEVQVTGVKWSAQQSSMVIAALDLSYLPGPVHLLPGSFSARMIESNGDVGVCGALANQVYLNRGTVTLEFQLPTEMGKLSVTGLSLTLSGGSNVPTVEAYDTSGEWIKVESPVWGNNELADPSRFILPGGVVRVRATANDMMGNCVLFDLDVEGIIENGN